MIKINGTLVSLDLLEENFTCDLEKCKGACCVQGESGAPLTREEVVKLKEIFPEIKHYLQADSRKEIEEKGVYYIDAEGEPVTMLNNGKECAFTVFENGIARCGIEKACNDGKINFRKPVSCHLYPVRIRKYKDYEAVNYDRWAICQPAINLGNRLKNPVFEFTRDSLIRRFGIQWYNELTLVADEYSKEKNNR